MSIKAESRAARVMVVDDQKLVMQSMVLALDMLGLKVNGHTCALEALEALEASPSHYDLLIADQRMPSLTGDELISKAKLIQPSIATVICSGLPSIETEGADAFLLKPFEIDQLQKVLEEVL